VTGGDALVRIAGADAAPQVMVRRQGCVGALQVRCEKRLVGLVAGLKDGDNALVERRAVKRAG